MTSPQSLTPKNTSTSPADSDPADSGKPPRTSDVAFGSALSERYLVYALSTITARSLPDLRDGLKPVHRRLLWAMRAMKLDPAKAFKKSARVVGEVIGKFHPHGDTAVYDAMVRLAQDFSLRYPLVNGQGNFGNIDGDNAAAYRYTEVRLTKVALDLMEGLDEESVNFRSTYNGEDEEPEIMPGLFPNLLANGTSGIAVGMATNIPPHNVGEIIDAALLLIKKPEASLDEVLEYVRGPDFPVGGIIVDSRETIRSAYASGRGGFRVRARFSTGRGSNGKWEKNGVEKLAGGSWQLVISEIPYGIAKGRLIEQIAQLIADKKLPILSDVRDESDTQIRIILTPRSRNVDPDVLKERLYRLTELESRFALNLNVLDAAHTPRVMGLKQVLSAWLKHQIIVLVRRAVHRLAGIDDRLELVAGYLIAFLNLDRIIEIIRSSKEPKPALMTEYHLSSPQAEAILNMRLRSLRKLEEVELRHEQAALLAERKDLAALIDSPDRQRTRLKKNLKAMQKTHGSDTPLGARRTSFAALSPARAIPIDAMIEREPVTVILSQRGWIRTQRGHLAPEQWNELKCKDGDKIAHCVHAQTTDKLLLAASDGRFYTLGVDKLPGGRGFGELVRLMLDIDSAAHILAIFPSSCVAKLLVASNSGHGFVVALDDVVAETRKGRGVVTVKPPARLVVARSISDKHDSIAVVGDNRKLIVFAMDEIAVMTKGRGSILQRYSDGGLADAISFRMADGISWPMRGKTGKIRTQTNMKPWRAARGTAGRMPPTGFPRSNKFA